MESEKVHVIFGTGGLGLSLAEVLSGQGKKVRLVNRSGRLPSGSIPQWEVTKADATNSNAAAEACKGAGVVYHCMGLPYSEWKEHMPRMMTGIIEGAAQAEAKLVYGDNLYAYGPVAQKLHEELPYKPVGVKTEVRANAANQLMEAYHSGRVRAAIGRGADFYGPWVAMASLGADVFKTAGTGKPVPLLGNPDLPHTYIYIKDFARGLAVLGEQESAIGQVWHIPSAETVTTRQLVELIGVEAGGQPIRYRVAGRKLVTFLSLFNSSMKELKEMLYLFEQPFEVDHSKFERAFGATVTPHREAVRETLGFIKSI